MSIDHTLEHVDEIGVGFDVVEFCRFDQRADYRPPVAAAIATGEQMIFSAKCDGTNRTFDGIGVELNAAVIEDA